MNLQVGVLVLVYTWALKQSLYLRVPINVARIMYNLKTTFKTLAPPFGGWFGSQIFLNPSLKP